MTLAANETRKIAVAVEPTDAPQGVVYESDDVSIATVDQNGVVTGLSSGSASITVKSTSNTLINDTVTVTVS
ncbi:TPA: Ig domain-containing protein [Vibrio cholerae]